MKKNNKPDFNNHLYLPLIFACLFLFPASCNKQVPEKVVTEISWPESSVEMKPWARWWWMGSAVDSANIEKLMKKYADAGIGGVEITPIYGAKGFEEKYLEYLSPEWMEALYFSVNKARALGMAVDMNVGTGWPFGGPQITPEFAAGKLIVQEYTLKSGQKLKEKIEVKDPRQQKVGVELLALMAFNQDGEKINLIEKVKDGNQLDWTPENGEWNILAAFSGKTLQKVKRAAPGGEGFTMDHMSKDALDTYLERFDQAFGKEQTGVRAFFNDSYEVYGADLSPTLFEEFKKRRGYDPGEYLRELTSMEDVDSIARIKSDYRETISDMLLENFSQPWHNWIHKQGGLSRNQAHGSPGNLLDLYAAVDIPETETFGSTYFPIPGLPDYTVDKRNIDPDPLMIKFATSAANVTGKPLVSSESFTWLGEHFKVSMSQCKPEVEQLFLTGVNHVFYHGTTFSPEEAGWPGWLFYASTNMAPSNSFWPHINGLNEYITRCQSFLQKGKSDNELLIYWPVYDVWHDPRQINKLLSIHHIDEWMHPTPFYKMSDKLYTNGYSMDFVSDKLIKEAEVKGNTISTSPHANPYQTLIIPACNLMPVETVNAALSLAENGGTIIFQQLPKDVPGYYQLEKRRQELRILLDKLKFSEVNSGISELKYGKGLILLAEDVQKALEYQNIFRESLTDNKLKFIRKDLDGNKIYYLANHTATSIDTWLPLNAKMDAAVIFDPLTGNFGAAKVSSEGEKMTVRVQMEPGESVFIQTISGKLENIEEWLYLESSEEGTIVSGEWELKFTSGGPELPESQSLTDLVSWTELPDEKAKAFSGSAEYTTTFEIPQKDADEYLLKLGDVRESAKIWINDQEVGILWGIPFQTRVGKYLKEGKNTLKIEVTNLMANRIIDLDKKGVEWRKYHEINFVDLNYKPFNAADWKLQPSGLLGQVTIVPMKADKSSQ
ncbi:glycosyl hydrolase [Flexithrix dorotheae]|uniref:glycosyl hydrolase n=1 Tax=Flexithrix dorotheae TaxID=70993 RepID=UPI00036A054F|nr:glycosyl hydrolase [Flexithrix dorotheae]